MRIGEQKAARYDESISRRSLIKLMALASPAFCGSSALLASPTHDQSAVHSGATVRPPRRPRLFYNAASLDRMKRLLASDSNARMALIKYGEELLAADLIPETNAERGSGAGASYRVPGIQITEMGLTLGLLFHLTGETRYAEKLRSALLYYSSYSRWMGEAFLKRSPSWHSELNTAKFSFGFASGYDALHGYLSEPDRKTIAAAMVGLALLPTLNDWILPGVRIHAFDSMGHNWWGVCVAGGGLCALALLDDDPRAQAWVDAIDAGFEQWFKYPGNVLQNRVPSFDRSGPSYEGVTYNNYAVSEYLHYRLAWQNTYPGKKAAHMEPLDRLATYFLHTLYPSSAGFRSVNFDDGGPNVDATASILLLIACGFSSPEAANYLKLVHTHPQGTLLSLLRQYPQPSAQVDIPASCIYSHMGLATMRSSWEDDATMLAMKSGYTWNHAHADAGSFILFKAGVPLIIDSGTCDYGRPEYSSYYRQSRAHNVILFDGNGQPRGDLSHGCKFPGHMYSLIDGLGMKYVYADGTGPMAQWLSRNYRHWLWSGDVVLIFDDVRAHAEGRLDWLLHFEGAYEVTADGDVALKNGRAEALIKMLYPAGSRHHEETGLADHDPDKKVPYLVFSSDNKDRLRQFITAICLDPAAAPKFEFLQGLNYIGVRIIGKETIEETYLNLRAIDGTIDLSSAVLIDGWTTDAYMFHVSRPASSDGEISRFFVSDGSYLRRSSKSYLESLSKLTACWSRSDVPQIFSDDGSVSIAIGVTSRPRGIVWNGHPVAANYDEQKGLVSIRRTL